MKNAQLRFPRKELHSKIYAFSKGNEDSWRDDDFECRTAVGSSNMTQGGFDINIETNVLLDGSLAKETMVQARHIFENAYELTSDVLDCYSEEYNDHPESLFPEIYESPVKLSKEYERIVGAVKHVAELCQDMIETNFPEVPRFLVVDHFWDYLIVTRKSDRDDIKERAHSSNNSDALIRELFTDYIQHECKNENLYPDEMNIRSKELVKYLNKQSLSNDDKKALFLTFHASRYYDDATQIKQRSL